MFHHSAALYLYHNHLTRQVEHAHSYGLWIWVVYWPSETSAHTDFHSFAEILISKSSFIAFSLKHEQDGRETLMRCRVLNSPLSVTLQQQFVEV